MSEKTCSKCGYPKPIAQFAKRSNRPDGRRSECKECQGKARAAYSALPAVKARARESERQSATVATRERYRKSPRRRRLGALWAQRKRATPEGQAALRRYRDQPEVKEREAAKVRGTYQANRQKRLCRALAGQAKKRGRLVPQPCQCCGTDKNVQMHHRDYSKPYEVEWICAKCHMRLHKLKHEEAAA